MTENEIRQAVLDAVARIVPEFEPGSLVATKSMREQLDMDSMDFLNFVIALHEALGIDIPERDMPRLGKLDSAVAYLAEQLRLQKAS